MCAAIREQLRLPAPAVLQELVGGSEQFEPFFKQYVQVWPHPTCRLTLLTLLPRTCHAGPRCACTASTRSCHVDRAARK